MAVTSDRGLCGGVHSNVCKAIKAIMNEMENTADTKLVLIGDKSKAMLSRYLLLFRQNVPALSLISVSSAQLTTCLSKGCRDYLYY